MEEDLIGAMASQECSIKIHLFDEINFAFWKIRMKTHLMSLGAEVWQSVLDRYKDPSSPTADQKL